MLAKGNIKIATLEVVNENFTLITNDNIKIWKNIKYKIWKYEKLLNIKIRRNIQLLKYVEMNLKHCGGEGTGVLAGLTLEVFRLQMNSLDVLVQVTFVA